MRIVYVTGPRENESASNEWRCGVPARAFNRTRLHRAELVSLEDFSRNTPVARAACEGSDVLVVERDLQGPVLPAIQHWKARDKVVIADFDAIYPLTPPGSPDNACWRQGRVPAPQGLPRKTNPPMLDQFKWGLRLVDGATVPSPLLGDDWRAYTLTRWLPNYIELEKYLNLTPQPHEGVILGWGGSSTHLETFTRSGLAAALRSVCKLRPRVRVMICGGHPNLLGQLGLPETKVLYKPWVPYAEWATHLSQFDIGLAPLAGEMDERRSWIRVLEYMVMKIPWVASAGPAYHEFSSFGWMVKNKPTDWEAVLLDMVDHLEDYRAEAAGEPYFHGIGKSIDDNIDRVLNTYLEIGGGPLTNRLL